MIHLTFYQEPVGKARPRVFRNVGKNGQHITRGVTPDKTAAAENNIRVQMLNYLTKKKITQYPVYEAGLPLSLTATFYRTKPLRPKHKLMPVTVPDLDNMAKLLLDALRGILFADDSQIVGMMLEKEWKQGGSLARIEMSIWETLPGDRPVKKM